MSIPKAFKTIRAFKLSTLQKLPVHYDVYHPGSLDQSLFEVDDDSHTHTFTVLSRAGEPRRYGQGLVEALESLALQIGQEQSANDLYTELVEQGVHIPENFVYATLVLQVLRHSAWNDAQEQADAFANWFKLFPSTTFTPESTAWLEKISEAIFLSNDSAPRLPLVMAFGMICAEKGYIRTVMKRLLSVVIRTAAPVVSFRYLGYLTEQAARHLQAQELQEVVSDLWEHSIMGHVRARRLPAAVYMIRMCSEANTFIPLHVWRVLHRTLLLTNAEPELVRSVSSGLKMQQRQWAGIWESETLSDDQAKTEDEEIEYITPSDNGAPLSLATRMKEAIEAAEEGRAAEVWSPLISQVIVLSNPRFGLPWVDSFLRKAHQASTNLKEFMDLEVKVMATVIRDLCVSGRTRPAYQCFKSVLARGISLPIATHEVMIRYFSLTEVPKVVRSVSLVLHQMKIDAGLSADEWPRLGDPRLTPSEMAATLRILKTQLGSGGGAPPVPKILAKWMVQYLDEGRTRAIVLLRNRVIKNGWGATWAGACMHVYHMRDQLPSMLLFFHRHFFLVDIPMSAFLVNLDRAKHFLARADMDVGLNELLHMPIFPGHSMFFPHRDTTSLVWSALTTLSASDEELEEVYIELMNQVNAWEVVVSNEPLQIQAMREWKRIHDSSVDERTRLAQLPAIPRHQSRDKPPSITDSFFQGKKTEMVPTIMRYDGSHIIPFIILFAKAGMVERCMELTALIQALGIPPSGLVMTLLVQANVRDGRYEEAEKVLSLMCTPSLTSIYDRDYPSSPLIAFHTLISGYMYDGNYEMARERLRWMHAEVWREMRMDPQSLRLERILGLRTEATYSGDDILKTG